MGFAICAWVSEKFNNLKWSESCGDLIPLDCWN
jgi:hypothetical protein